MSLNLRLIQDLSKSNSERGKDKNLYLSEEAGLTLLLGKIQSFKDYDWLVVQEGNKRALLGFIISLHFEITCIIFPVLFYFLTHKDTDIYMYILYFCIYHVVILNNFLVNEQ